MENDRENGRNEQAGAAPYLVIGIPVVVISALVVRAVSPLGALIAGAIVLLPVLVACASLREGGGCRTLGIAIGVLCAVTGVLLLVAATENVPPSAPGSSTHGLAFVFLPIWCGVGAGILCLCHMVGRAVGEWLRVRTPEPERQ